MILFVIFLFNTKKINHEASRYVQVESYEAVNMLHSRDGMYCFTRTQIATESNPYEVQENISFAISGTNVTGRKQGIQSGPDMTNGYEGSLSGSIENDEMRLVFSYTIEGSQGKELELYSFNGDELQKYRYVLEEGDSMLVPNMSTQASIISYTQFPCQDFLPQS